MDNAHLHNPSKSASQSSNNSPNLHKAHTLDSSPEKNHSSALNFVWTDSESESEDPARKSTNQGTSLHWTGPKNRDAGMLAIWDGNTAASDADVDMPHKNITTTIQGVEDNDLALTKNGNPSPPPRVPTPFPFFRPNGYKAPAYKAPVLPRSAACLSLQSLAKPCSSVLGAPSASTHEPSTWPVPALQYMPASALEPNSSGPVKSPYRENWNMAPPVLPGLAFPLDSSEQNSPPTRTLGLPLHAPKPATWHQPTLRDGSPSKAPMPSGVPLESQIHSAGPVEPSDSTKLPVPGTSADFAKFANWLTSVQRPDQASVHRSHQEGVLRDQQWFLESLKRGFLPGDWQWLADELFPDCRPATGWPDNIFTPKALLDLLSTPVSPPPSPPRPRHAMPDPAKKPGPSMPPLVLPPGTGPVNILSGREQLLPQGGALREQTPGTRAQGSYVENLRRQARGLPTVRPGDAQ